MPNSNSYTLPHATDTPAETERLDQIQEFFHEFFKGRLSLAPIEEMNPTSVLDLGAGSGAWQVSSSLFASKRRFFSLLISSGSPCLRVNAAAKTFPEAKVVAVDLNPLPSRALPSNVTFVRADITQHLPFEPQTFDVIHLRLVLLHLPDGPQILERIFTLLKPGGWLLVEDIGSYATIDGAPAFAPGASVTTCVVFASARRGGAESATVPNLRDILEGAGVFDDVRVEKMTAPMTPGGFDPALDKLGEGWRDTFERLALALMDKYGALGLTRELVEQGNAVLRDPSQRLGLHCYVACARRNRA